MSALLIFFPFGRLGRPFRELAANGSFPSLIGAIGGRPITVTSFSVERGLRARRERGRKMRVREGRREREEKDKGGGRERGEKEKGDKGGGRERGRKRRGKGEGEKEKGGGRGKGEREEV